MLCVMKAVSFKTLGNRGVRTLILNLRKLKLCRNTVKNAFRVGIEQKHFDFGSKFFIDNDVTGIQLHFFQNFGFAVMLLFLSCTVK